MKYMKPFAVILAFSMIATGCSVQPKNRSKNTTDEVESEEVTYKYSDDDKRIADWFKKCISDEEEFTDKVDYQLYARALDLDKDYFLDPSVWEVYYNLENVNRNHEVTGIETYLIRLNPKKLLEQYAIKNDCTVKDICDSLSVTDAQLYYNWGYLPTWENYSKYHKKDRADYSQQEIAIFGIYNGDDRAKVMKTHMITIDKGDGNTVAYKSDISEELEIYRKDSLHINFTEDDTRYLYSDYSADERNAAFKVDGIGIRSVIPLSLPNTWYKSSDADAAITPFINRSPFAYGCNTSDIIDITAILESEEK